MAMKSCDIQDRVRLAVLENDTLRVTVAPSVGGRVIAITHRPSGREFLWRNPRLDLARDCDEHVAALGAHGGRRKHGVALWARS